MLLPDALEIRTVTRQQFVAAVAHGDAPPGEVALAVGALHGITLGRTLWACAPLPKRPRPPAPVDQAARLMRRELARIAVLRVVRVAAAVCWCTVVSGTLPPAGARCYVVEE